MSKLTIQDLIKKKENITAKKKERRDLSVKSLEGDITIEKRDRDLFLEAADMEDGRNDLHIVYHSVVEPNLKDPELQKAFEVVEPIDIVEKLFDPGEIVGIVKACGDLAGYSEDSVQLVEELKN